MFESFFLLSLGVTFVLLVLLVFHFRNRISSLEQKAETMFSLLNNVVTELNNMRGGVHPPMVHMSEQPIQSKIEVQLSEDDDDSGAESDDVSESESDDDSGAESDDDSDADAPVKTVNMEIDATFDDIPVETTIGADEDTETPYVIEPSIIDAPLPEIELVVNKSDTNLTEHLDETVASASAEEAIKENGVLMVDEMTLPELRTYANEKGLVTDASRMKRHTLLKLIQSAE
mgnify:CR=1 FL=1